MSGWWSSGRYSPFGFHNPRGPPKVTEDDFSYLSGDSDRQRDRHDSHPHHDQHEYRHENSGFPRQSSHAEPQELDPDVLILKHKGISYTLHFDAFAIAESLKVGQLRHEAAKTTNCNDPRRVKLLYKGRSLRNDAAYCRDEGLKHNSELSCVVSSETILRNPDDDDDDSISSSSASSAAIANGVDIEPGTYSEQSRRSKRKHHRGGTKMRNREAQDDGGSTRHNDSQTSTRRGRETGATGSSSNLAPPPASSASLEPPNAQHFSRNRSPSVVRRAPSPAVSTPTKPLTPAETIEAISKKLHNEFVPKVQDLLAQPPSDPKTRAFESKKLSEGILMQVLLKLDAVDTDEETVKAKRKECVKEANYWSTELDRLGGEGK